MEFRVFVGQPLHLVLITTRDSVELQGLPPLDLVYSAVANGRALKERRAVARSRTLYPIQTAHSDWKGARTD